MILIKGYTNRKLYDTKNSKYVTISDIVELIKNNEEIKVIENNTQEDITNVIMAQVLLKIEQKEKASKGTIYKKGIKSLIQNSGDSFTAYINKTKQTIKNEFDKILKKSENELNDLIKQFHSFYESSSTIIENIPKRIDDKVKEAVNTLFPVQRIKEFDNLLKKVKILEEKIELMEKRISELENNDKK